MIPTFHFDKQISSSLQLWKVKEMATSTKVQKSAFEALSVHQMSIKVQISLRTEQEGEHMHLSCPC